MADYHPLISRAVAGLDGNTGENRRVLYERARAALVTQLRNVDPPLDESDITRERLALEEAIRKVEAEAAQRALAAGSRRRAAEDPGQFAERPRLARLPRNHGGGRRAWAVPPREAHRSAQDFYGRPSRRGRAAAAAAEAESAPSATHYFEPHEGEPHEARRTKPSCRRSASRDFTDEERRRPRAAACTTSCRKARCRRRRPMTSTRKPMRGRRAPGPHRPSRCWSWRSPASPAPATGSATPSPAWWRASAPRR